MEVLSYFLTGKIQSLFEAHGLYYIVKRMGSMFCVFFTEDEVYDYESALKCDTGKYARYYQEVLKEGIYFPPSQFEVSFISCAHEMEDIYRTIEAIEHALDKIK